MQHKVTTEKMVEAGSSWGACNPSSTSVIECELCRYSGYSELDYAEVEALLYDGSISRFCPRCGETTRWREVDIHTEAGKSRSKGADLPEISRASSTQLIH